MYSLSLNLIHHKVYWHSFPAHDSLTCFLSCCCFLVLFTVSLTVWFTVLSWARLQQSGSDDIIAHIVLHLLTAQREKTQPQVQGDTENTHIHSHTSVSPAGHLRISAVHFLSPRLKRFQVKVGVTQLAD